MSSQPTGTDPGFQGGNQDYQQPPRNSGGGGTGVPGWVWFLLIYGVGNFILYQTTGILLLPIPRK